MKRGFEELSQTYGDAPPGTPVEKHLDVPTPTLRERVDVDGNQLELLERSACFVKSNMTCMTCHDVSPGAARPRLAVRPLPNGPEGYQEGLGP